MSCRICEDHPKDKPVCRTCRGTGIVPSHHPDASNQSSGEIVADSTKSYCRPCRGTGMAKF